MGGAGGEAEKYSLLVALRRHRSGSNAKASGADSGATDDQAFVPKRASARNEKTVVEYDQARGVSDLMRFATSRMPNYVESLAGATELGSLRSQGARVGAASRARLLR